MIYLTSDTHFSHANIIKYCNRPFDNAIIMNNRIIENWNSVVGKDDEVFHLGDVGCWFKENAWIEEILPNLNGKKFLIPGNHDKKFLQVLKRHFTVLPPIHNIIIENEECGRLMAVLCHYPIYSWDGQFHGAIHVGVDGNDFKPLSAEEIIIKTTKQIIGNNN